MALAMWDKVKDIAPAINIAAAPPQTNVRAFFACTCISVFSIADRVETITVRTFAVVAFYQHSKTKNSTLIEIKFLTLTNAQFVLAWIKKFE